MSRINKFYRTEVLTTIRETEDLGLKSKPEWQPISIDINEVAAFMYDEDSDNTPVTQITLKSGVIFSIKDTFEEFEKLIHQS